MSIQNQPLTIPLLQSLVSPLSTQPPRSQALQTLISSLQILESTASITTIGSTTSEVLGTYYALYILSLLLDDDLEEARYLTHRIDPTLLNNDAIVISAYRVLQSLYGRWEMEGFHGAMMGGSGESWGSLVGVVAILLLGIVHQQVSHMLTANVITDIFSIRKISDINNQPSVDRVYIPLSHDRMQVFGCCIHNGGYTTTGGAVWMGV